MVEVFVKRLPIHSDSVFFGARLQIFPQAIVDGGNRLTFAGNFSRHALRYFAGRAVVNEQIELRLALYIDEARRYNQTSGIHSLFSRALLQIADGRDPVAGDANVTYKPRCTR